MQFNVFNKQTQKEAVDYIASLNPEENYTVRINKKRHNRTVDQNRLYWLWLTCIEQETGNSKDDLHDFFRTIYLGIELRNVLGNDYSRLKSTTLLNTSEFKQYLDKIQIFANTEIGITLPNPEDLEFERFKDYYSKFI